MGLKVTGLSMGILLFVLSACTAEKKEAKISEGAPVRAQIPVYAEGTYHMEIVELFGLKSLTELQGTAARFLINPSISEGSIQGQTPHLNYMRDSNDVIVATDEVSLQLLTLYAHYEKLHALDETAGAKDVLAYPRTVAVNAKFRSSQGLVENNALYSGHYDALMVVPYTQNSLPLMANAGVIGHEHFHALFQKLVIEASTGKFPDPDHATLHPIESMTLEGGRGARGGAEGQQTENPREKYHAALLRAVNEGLADVWGWIYSGDDNFVGRSLPSEKIRRQLDVIPEFLATRDELLSPIAQGAGSDHVLALSYQFGTQLARSIRNFANLYGLGKEMKTQEIRAKLAQVLISSLPKLQEKYFGLKDEEYLTLSAVFSLIVDQMPDIQSEECKFVERIIPKEEKGKVSVLDQCKAFTKKEDGPKE
jgi:hypothetical protein